MNERQVTILTGDPTIAVVAEMRVDWDGVGELAEWVRLHRPECLPEDYNKGDALALFPHTGNDLGRLVTSNELLVELAGRKCYDSFGDKAGRKTNAEYIANTQASDIPHRSILYHAKMSFFFAGISRRVSHEIIRNYVGADRSEEGNPSQESTRFTHHYGFFVCPPRYIGRAANETHFRYSMESAYRAYLRAVEMETGLFKEVNGREPKSLDKKRIYEAASSFLPHQAETSFIWTTNPAAIAKFVQERDNEAADLEIQRFAKKLKRISLERWPNLFPQWSR